MANMRWCHRHIFLVNSDDKEGVHWFVCAFDCRVWLELFTIWVWEPLSSTDLICPFLSALKKSLRTTKHHALGFQMDNWSSKWFSKLEHREVGGGAPGYFFQCAPRLNGCRFGGLCAIGIVNADCAMRVVQRPVMMWRG